MEKEHHQPDSIATVTIKPDYAPSEIYSTSEPPPAYMKNVHASVQVAKIIATTVVLCSVILGFFLLASAYVTANASCKQLEQELELLGEVADRFQQPSQQSLQPEALIQENPNKRDDESKSNEEEPNDDDDNKLHFKLPLQLNFDDLAGALIEKNQRSKMNCIVEKKRAEQLVDHQAKTVELPFGLNLTTDPRLEKITGERMAIFCESGTANSQRASGDDEKEESEENDVEDDQNEATIMIQPVMIPIPPSHFQTHMSQQMQPQQNQPQQIHVQEHIMIQPQQQHHQMPPQPFSRYPPHPMEQMRPPMPPQQQQMPSGFPPADILKQIAEQIVAQKEREDMIQQQQQQQQSRQAEERIRFPMPNMIAQMRIPMSELIMNQLNRLPSTNRGEVIVALEEQPSNNNNNNDNNNNSDEEESQEEQRPTELRVVQEQRRNPAELNGRQSYGRAMPIDIPEQMMKQQQEQQEPEAQASEGVRPHFVQPRSVRNKRDVETLLKSTKRVKRCACDCSC